MVIQRLNAGLDSHSLNAPVAASSPLDRLSDSWRSFLDKQEINGKSFKKLIDSQIRFRVTHEGGVARAVPDSPVTQALWGSDQRLRRFADGVVLLAKELDGSAKEIDGFTLASSRDGALANRLLHEFASEIPASQAAFTEGLAKAKRQLDKTVAVRKGAWFHLGRDRSNALLDAITGAKALSSREKVAAGMAVKTILHELNHLAPTKPVKTPRLAWLAEGRAEVLARFPGRVEHAANLFGFDVPEGIGRMAEVDGPYPNQVLGVRKLLELGGASSYKQAIKMLDWHAEGGIQAAIGSAIAKEHASSKETQKVIEGEVRKLLDERLEVNGSKVDLTQLWKFEDSYL